MPMKYTNCLKLLQLSIFMLLKILLWLCWPSHIWISWDRLQSGYYMKIQADNNFHGVLDNQGSQIWWAQYARISVQYWKLLSISFVQCLSQSSIYLPEDNECYFLSVLPPLLPPLPSSPTQRGEGCTTTEHLLHRVGMAGDLKGRKDTSTWWGQNNTVKPPLKDTPKGQTSL